MKKMTSKYLLVVAFILLFAVKGYSQDFATTIAKHREEYKAAFLKEERSPLKEKDLKNLDFYAADSTYAVTAKVELLNDDAVILIPTYSGAPREYLRYAQVKFMLGNQLQVLTLYKSIALSKLAEFKNYLFLPFNDPTNGKETYGGGRYMDLNQLDIQNEQIKLDFNKAYNPYCAFSDGYQCPKPPKENELKLDITAGEKKFLGAH